MHENREISSTPWSDDQDRSAKATSRTADMYVPEKSDCAVVPRFRLLSAYTLTSGTKIWVITEADRSVTTVLLPEEY
jgi:hypothetical protein